MRRLLALLSVPLAGLCLAACGGAVSTSQYKGARHDVAQTLADLQSDVTASDQKKICGKDLSGAVVSRLGGTKKCESALKKQLTGIDSTELKIESIAVAASGAAATANVKSVFEGKSRRHNVALVKEGDRWKVSSFQ